MNAIAENEVKQTETQNAVEQRPYVSPDVNILETKDGYVLEAEMPGVARDGLTVSVEDGVLTLVGRRQSGAQGSALYRESRAADYRRLFHLDPSIETDRITARIEQGILTVTLPKAEKAKPRQIAVN